MVNKIIVYSLLYEKWQLQYMPTLLRARQALGNCGAGRFLLQVFRAALTLFASSESENFHKIRNPS